MVDLWWCFPLIGVAAGLLAGLLGVGGGLVIVAALAWLLPQQGVPAEVVMHVALATSLASIVLTAISSGAAHHRRGSVLWPSVAWLVPGLLIGGGLGGTFAGGVDGRWLRAGVILFCLLAAAQLWRGSGRRAAGQGPPSSPAPRGVGLSAAGIAIGAISSWVGIGGGSLTVPLLIARGAPAVRAVGTSAVCGFFIGVAAAAAYARLVPPEPLGSSFVGYLYWPGALLLAVASVLVAPLGARLAHRLRGERLQRVFALFLIAMAVITALAPRG